MGGSPFQPETKKWYRNRRRVVYGAAGVDDCENASAFDTHGATYSAINGSRKVRGRENVTTAPDDPYCHLAKWMRARRDIDQEECLFLPGAHPGFRADVRFNFRRVAAARAMCILAHGTPPFKGAMALHSCGNGHLSCVNPKHLRWGTAKDNARDAALHHGKAQIVGADAEISDAKLPKVAAIESGMTAATVRAVRSRTVN